MTLDPCITLTLYHNGEPGVGIAGDQIDIKIPEWFGDILDDDDSKDEQGRTWRQQLEQESMKLYGPFMDFPLRPLWSDQQDDTPHEEVV